MYKGKYVAAKAAKKKSVKVGTILFYVLYLLMILAFFVGLFHVLEALEEWLVRYEASQPKVQCRQVFEELFAEPDWGELYDLAGIQDTQFEGKESFISYMQSRTGEITYSETSAGLSGDHKYIVKQGDEKIATFTLTAPEHTETQIAQWELGTVELFFEREESVTVFTQADRTVYINGQPLDENHTVRTTVTAVESYLPEGLHGRQTKTVYAENLLAAPQVTAVDGEGNAVALTYDENTAVYSETLPEMTISQEESDALVQAAKTYSEYMIEVKTLNELVKYFDRNSDVYSTIRKMDTWAQTNYGYSFTEPVITEYYRYSETVFSANLTMTLEVKRSNGTVKEYPLDTTFFLTNGDSGWLVTEMTNINVQEQTEYVRLVYMLDGQELSREMVEQGSELLTTPAVAAPEGKTFLGWFRQVKDENGNETLELVFAPNEDGTVALPAGSVLEPMTLQALFE